MSATMFVATTAAVLLIVGAIAVFRTAPVRRTMWLGCQPARLSAGRFRRSLRKLVNWVCQFLSWFMNSPLSIEPIGSILPGEGETVGAELSAAVGRIGASGRASVDVVHRRWGARPLVEDVADALAVDPRGKWLGALLRLGGRVLGRGTMRLTGHVLDSAQRGPGLALSLLGPWGKVIDNTTLWAVDYEPNPYAEDLASDSRCDRILRLATAGAVWTHFAFTKDRRGLRDDDFVAGLGTRDWQSYASVQLGIDRRGTDSGVKRALYAQGVDRDPDNLLAHFNLAADESVSRDPGDRHGARQRLWWIHERVEWENAARCDWQSPFGVYPHGRAVAPHEPSTQPQAGTACEASVYRQAAAHTDGAGATKNSEARLDLLQEHAMRGRAVLDDEPLHYQVLYKESALVFNDSVRKGITKGCPPHFVDQFYHLTSDLVVLEDTLSLLEFPNVPPESLRGQGPTSDGALTPPMQSVQSFRVADDESARRRRLLRRFQGWWSHPARYTRQGEELAQLLRSFEGPLLSLWLSFNCHADREDAKRAASEHHGAEPNHLIARDPHLDLLRWEAVQTERVRTNLIVALAEVLALETSYQPSRERAEGLPSHATTVMEYLRHAYPTRVNSRTRYNLAGYYADIARLTQYDSPKVSRDHEANAFRELRRSLQDAHIFAWACSDPQLACLKQSHDWRVLAQLYTPETLDELDAIGVRHASDLRRAGIKTIDGLIKGTRTRRDIDYLAHRLGLKRERIERWARLAELTRQLDASAAEINLLDRLGLANIEGLTTVEPNVLEAALGHGASSGTDDGDGRPFRQRAEELLDAARSVSEGVRVGV